METESQGSIAQGTEARESGAMIVDRKDQHRLIVELTEVAGRLSREDSYDLAMFKKRDADDEDLDLPSQRRLEELHGRYVKKSSPTDIDSILKKYSRQVKDFGPSSDK
jgi:hypothetical protein